MDIVFALTGLLNEDLLLLLQDICIQCVFAGLEWDGTSQSSDKSQSNSSQKTLYSPQCLLSALRTARKLTQAKQSRTLLSNIKHPIIELTKGDNSGMYYWFVYNYMLCVCMCLHVLCVCVDD